MSRTRLSSEAADQARQVIAQMAAAGKSQEEVDQWISDFKAQQAGKTSTPPSQNAGATDAGVPEGTVSASEDPSSGLLEGETEGKDETWGQFVQDKQGRRFYRDNEGDINQIAGEAGAIIQKIPFFGDIIDDVYGAYKQGRAQARSVDDALNLFAQGEDVSQEDLAEYIQRIEEMEGSRVSDDMKEFNEIYEASNGGALGFVKAIAMRPQAALETIVSSMVAMVNPGSIPGAAAGAAAGAGAGAALGAIGGPLAAVTASAGAVAGVFGGISATLDTAMSYTEFLQEEVAKKGLEFDEEGIREVLEDKEALSRIRGRSAGRGLTIGLVDGLTAGIAGKVGSSLTKTAKLAGKTAAQAATKGGLAAFGVEAVGGGLGETAGRLVADQELDAREIGLEVVGEFGQGAGPVFAGVRRGFKKAAQAAGIAPAAVKQGQKQEDSKESNIVNGNQLDDDATRAFLTEMTPSEIGAADVQISNNPELQELYLRRKTGIKNINNGNEYLDSGSVEAKEALIGGIEAIDRRIQEAQNQGLDTRILREERKAAVGELKSHRALERKIIAKIPENQKGDLLSYKDELNDIETQLETLPDDTQNDGLRKKLQERADKTAGEIAAILEPATLEATSEVAEATVEQQQEEAAVSKQREEFDGLVNDDLETSQKKFEGIESGFAKTLRIQGSNRVAPKSKVNKSFPISKSGENFVEGDFVKTINTIKPVEEGEANETIINLTKQAESANFDVDVKTTPAANGQVNIEGTITAKPREKTVTAQLHEEKGKQGSEADAALDVEEGAALDQESTYKPLSDEEANAESETLAKTYAASTEPKHGGRAYEGEVINTPESITYPGVNKTNAKEAGIFPLVKSLQASGYPDARYTIGENETVVTKGKYDDDVRRAQTATNKDKVRFSIGEATTKAGQEANQSNKFSGEAKDRIERVYGPKKVKGENVSLNIGHENNPLSHQGIVSRLEQDPRFTLGQAENKPQSDLNEPTTVIAGKFNGTKAEYQALLKEIADETGQDAIGGRFGKVAPQTDGTLAESGVLVHGTNPRENWGDFNPKYYQEPSTASKGTQTGDQGKDGLYKPVDGVIEIDGVSIPEEDMVHSLLTTKGEPKQSFIKIPLEGISTEERAANVGGKSGFGGSVDKEAQANTTEGKKIDAADRMQMIEDFFAGKKPAPEKNPRTENLEETQRVREKAGQDVITVERDAGEAFKVLGTEIFKNVNDAIRKLTPYGITPKLMAKGEPMTLAHLEEIRKSYDALIGYKGAHENLDKKWRIGVVNDLNVEVKKEDPTAKWTSQEKATVLGAAIDRDLSQAANWNRPLEMLSMLTGYKILAHTKNPETKVIDDLAAKIGHSSTAIRSFGTGYGTLNKKIGQLNNLLAILKTTAASRGIVVAPTKYGQGSVTAVSTAPISETHKALSALARTFREGGVISDLKSLRAKKDKLDVLASKVALDEDGVATPRTSTIDTEQSVKDADRYNTLKSQVDSEAEVISLKLSSLKAKNPATGRMVSALGLIPNVPQLNSLFGGSLARERALASYYNEEIDALSSSLPNLNEEQKAVAKQALADYRKKLKDLRAVSIAEKGERSLIDAFIKDLQVQDSEKRVTDELVDSYLTRPVDNNIQDNKAKKSIEDRLIHTLLRPAQFWVKDAARRTGREIRNVEFNAGLGRGVETDVRKAKSPFDKRTKAHEAWKQEQKEQQFRNEEFNLQRKTRDQAPDIMQVATEIISLAVKYGKIPNDYAAYSKAVEAKKGSKDPNSFSPAEIEAYGGFKTFNPTNAKEALTQLKGPVRDSISEYYENEGLSAGKAKVSKQARTEIKSIKAAQQYLQEQNIFFDLDGNIVEGNSNPNDPNQIRQALARGFKTKNAVDAGTGSPIARGTRIKEEFTDDQISSRLETMSGFPKSQKQRRNTEGDIVDIIETAQGPTSERLAQGFNEAKKGSVTGLLLDQNRIDNIIKSAESIIGEAPQKTDAQIIQEAGVKRGKNQERAIDNYIEKRNKKLDDRIETEIGNNLQIKTLRNVTDSILINGETLSLQNLSDQTGIPLSEFQNAFDTAKPVRAIKNLLAAAIAPEIHAQLSPEVRYHIEAGTETLKADTGRRFEEGGRAENQINTHMGKNKDVDGDYNRLWNKTTNELNNTIKKTDFNKDWIQWAPGDIFNDARAVQKGLDPNDVALLRTFPDRIGKMLNKYNQGKSEANKLHIRPDTSLNQNGLYHIYKTDGPGSKPKVSKSISEQQAERTVADKPYLDAVTDALKAVWPDITVRSTIDQWVAGVTGLRLGGVSIPQSTKGLYIPGQNRILIKPGMATLDTPIHEFAHIWAAELQRNNPKLWIKGRELLKGSDYVKSILRIPEYRQLLKEAPSQFWEEAMANAIGKRGAILFAEKKKAGTWNNWMKSFGKWIKDTLGINSEKSYDNLTLDDWIDIGVQGTFSGSPKNVRNTSGVRFSLAENFEKVQSQKAAPKKGLLGKAKDWLVGPGADDFHGLIQRFETDAKASKNYEAIKSGLENLKTKYVDQYQKHLENATQIRENVYNAENKLIKAMKLGEFKDFNKEGTLWDSLKNSKEAVRRGRAATKMYKKLAQPAKGKNGKAILYKGQPITVGQAIGISMNPKEMTDHSEATKFVNANPELKTFSNELGKAAPAGAPKFVVDPSGSFQYNTVQYINKDLLKSDLADFITAKKAFQKENTSSITSDMNEPYATALNGSLDRMGGDTPPGSDFDTSKFHTWLQGSVGTIMFLNVRSAALQTLSIANYMTYNNIGSYASDFMKAGTKGTKQYEIYEKLWNSSYLKERRARAGFDVNAEEIANKFAGREGKFSKAVQWALNKGFVLTSLADGFAIARGGAAYVHGLMKEGKSFEDAKKLWIEQSEEAQQSARADRVSQQQKSGISKFVLAFANTPQQYFRLSQKAFRKLKSEGNGNIVKGLKTAEGKKAARQILYYVAAQNMIFTSLQAMSPALFAAPFTEDEDDDKDAARMVNSMSDTVLRGMGLYGAVVSAVKNVGINLYNEKDKANPNYGLAGVKGGVGLAPPLSRKVNDLLQIGNAYKYDKGNKGFRSAHAQAVGKGLALANIPADWIQKKLAAIQYLFDEGLDVQNTIDVLEMLYGNPEFIATKGSKSDTGLSDSNLETFDLEEGELNDSTLN